MAKQATGDNANTDDPKDKGNKQPADDDSGKGAKGSKAKAGDQGDDEDPNEKKFSRADLDAELARDRQERRRTQQTKSPSTSKKKDQEEEGEDPEKEELRKELRQTRARESFEDALTDAGFAKPRKMYRLLKDDLTFDANGKPDNIKDLITIAKRDYSEELNPDGKPKPKGSADAGAKGASGVKSSSTMNDFIRRAAGRQ